MEQFYMPYLFSGLFRLGLFVLLISILYHLAGPKSGKTPSSNYAGFMFYICALVLLCFVLVQINAFDRFTIFLFMFGYIALKGLDLRWGIPFNGQLIRRRENTLLFFIKLTDTDASFSVWLKTTFCKKLNISRAIKKLFSKNVLIRYGIPVAIFITAYLSRVYFLNFDSYTMSEIWYKDLSIVKGLSKQNWLSNQDMILGEFALINLYSQITGISNSLALQTFGLLESALLAVSVFWGVSRFTQTKWFPGLIAAFGFIFLYGFMLLDIATITQHRSVYLALAIIFPVFVMVLQPKILSKYKTAYFFKMLVLFCGMAFIDLFVMLVVLPLFLFFAFFCIPKIYRPYFERALLAYGISLIIVFVIHGVELYHRGGSLIGFINSNLFSVSSYTYLPQLILPFSEFIVYVKLLALISLIVVIPLWFRNKKKWYPLLTLSLLFLSLTLLMNAKNIFFDKDLLIQVISVFIPVSLVGLVWSILHGVLINLKLKNNIPVPYSLSMVVILIGIPGYWQNQKPFNSPKRNLLIENILSTYNNIEGTFLPFSYAVVNYSSSAPISVDSHYFINYEFFNTQYLSLDAIYAKNRSDKAFLKENPDLILPKSTFVFLYRKDAILNGKNGINEELQKKTRENLLLLRQRKRQIKLFYKTEQMEVYEIINEPNLGNINDLLSKNN